MKNNIKKTGLAALMILVSFFAAGCKKSKEAQEKSGKVNVVASFFPLYDWTRNIAGDSENVNLEMLVKNGVDLHSFQPSASDMVKISTCDVLIYTGGESDVWITDALKNSVNKNMKAISLMEVLADSVREEETVEGMQETEEHNHDEEEETELDEHVWLSVVNAKVSCEKICEVLCEADPANEEKYRANLASYTAELDGIWASNSTKERKLMIVCDRFPFRYMADELGAVYFAAFNGCSAETEASFETVAFLSGKVKETGTKKVYVTEGSDKKIARTVIKNAGLTEAECEIRVLDSLQNTTLAQALAGKNYVEVMKENFKQLK